MVRTCGTCGATNPDVNERCAACGASLPPPGEAPPAQGPVHAHAPASYSPPGASTTYGPPPAAPPAGQPSQYPPPAYGYPPPSYVPVPAQRPNEATIAGVILFAIGLLWFAVPFLFAAIAAAFAFIPFFPFRSGSGSFGDFIFVFFSLPFLAAGIVWLFSAWGLLSDRPWGPTAAILVSVIGILMSLVTAAAFFPVAFLLAYLVVLFLVTRPEVKTWYATRQPAVYAIPYPYPPPYSPPPR